MARFWVNSSDFTPVVLGRVVAAGPVHILLTLSVGMTPGCAEAPGPVIRNVNNSGFLLSVLAPHLPAVPRPPHAIQAVMPETGALPQAEATWDCGSNGSLLATYPEPEAS